MYLVKNDKRCKEMMERAKDNIENFNTSLVEIIQKENIFNTLKIITKKLKKQLIELKKILMQKISQNLNQEYLFIHLQNEIILMIFLKIVFICMVFHQQNQLFQIE